MGGHHSEDLPVDGRIIKKDIKLTGYEQMDSSDLG
jgi:hypothetical protein